MAIALADVRAAAAVIDDQLIRTPCALSPGLSKLAGADVYVKFENLQHTASFKARGALVRLHTLTEAQKRAGVVAMSAGNHAQAVAYHARRLGIPAVIVMPEFTPLVKVERTRGYGAEVILHGKLLEESAGRARELAEQRGLFLVHPYDDEKVMAGQGTIALEMLEDVPDLDVLFVPIGGGGLIAGVATAAKALKPQIRIIGVEAARFPSMYQALRGEPIRCGTATIAEGIAVKQPGRLTLPVVRALVDDLWLADELDIEQAVLLFLEEEKTVAEGAGAAGLAALFKRREDFRGQRVGVILCGGNIDMPVLASIIQRGLVRSGRMVRLVAKVRDVPGGLARLSQVLAQEGANIVEVRHQRAFAHTTVESVEIEFVVLTRGEEHAAHLVDTMARTGAEVFRDDEDRAG